jgi:hypothetical protein
MRFVCLFIIILGAGCAAAPAPVAVVECAAPRPQVCTMEYAPVCANLSAGGRGDYASACNACADDAVASYEDGACSDPAG